MSCGFPGHLVNGYVEGRSYSYGDTIMFTCNPGFMIIGEEKSVCQADGKWSNKLPKCDGEVFSDLHALFNVSYSYKNTFFEHYKAQMLMLIMVF